MKRYKRVDYFYRPFMEDVEFMTETCKWYNCLPRTEEIDDLRYSSLLYPLPCDPEVWVGECGISYTGRVPRDFFSPSLMGGRMDVLGHW